MNTQTLRNVLISALVAVSSFGVAQAQTVTVNGSNCTDATVTLGAGTININTGSCGGTTTTLTAPSFTSGTPAGTGNVGAAYSSFTFTASGNPTPTFALVTAGSLPPGLNLASNGVLSGTPTTAGTYTFAVRATNSQGSALSPASGTHSIVITNTPAITSVAPPNGSPGVAYAHQFIANQAVTAWSATPPPPAGLTLDSATGLLAGSPTAAGTVSFTVSAATANGTATQAVTFSVTAPIAPTFTSAAPPAGTAGTPYSFAFTASGTPAPTFTLVTPNTQPTGLTLSSSGILSGTPTTAGTYTFAVQAANSAGAVVSPATGTHSVVIGAAPVATGAIVADTNGNVIPKPVSRAAKAVLAAHSGPNGGGNYPGQEIRGWGVSPTRCTNTQPAITSLWYHNIDILDYGQQTTIDYFDFAPNQAVSYGFVPNTPVANNSQVGTIFVTTGPVGTPAATFLTISTSPCDFDVAKLAAANPCYNTGTSENGVTFQITTNPTSPVCKLTPGVQYYLNLRFQDARPAPIGSPTSDACVAQLARVPGYATCGALLKIQTF